MTIYLKHYEIKIQAIPMLVFIILLVLLIYLGNWQLSRSYEKQSILQAQQTAIHVKPIELSKLSDAEGSISRYLPVKAIGHYDVTHQFLLENQVLNGKVGYLVLTPFVLNDRSNAVLVNRGWLPAGQNRLILPDVTITTPPTEIEGRINWFPSVGLILAGAEQPSENWPSRVQVVNSRLLSEKLGYPLRNFQIELAENQPNGYQRSWQTSTLMPPEQHKAYAFQWFGLAFALTFLFIRYSIKKRHD